MLAIYPGKSTSGANAIYSGAFTATGTTRVVEAVFTAPQSEVTLSVRHMSNDTKETNLNIKRVAFVERDSYNKQKQLYEDYENWEMDGRLYDRYVDEETNKQYVLFGEYPQTIKASEVNIIENDVDFRGYYLGSDGARYEKVTGKKHNDNSILSDGTNVTNNATYYFKVEPVLWRVLLDEDGYITMHSDLIINAMRFSDQTSNFYAIKIINYIEDEKIDLTNDELSFNDVKNKSLFAHLKITLVDQDNNELKGDEIPEGTYIVSFLLPDEFKGRENIRVVYLSEEKVEVFKTEVNENYWLTFETTHFSDFFLIADPLPQDLLDGSINLWWAIILELVIITGLVVGIILKKKDNNEKRINSNLLPILALIVPNNAVTTIVLLGIVIILLTLYLIYLFIGLDWLKSEKEETVVVKELPKEEKVEVKELPKEKEVFVAKTVDDLEKESKVLFNYSFKARLHLANPVTVDRFNEIKNYILSYDDIKVSKTWAQETYLFKNTSVFKVRVSGKTMNLFFNLNPNDFEGTKYTFEDRSNVKTHAATPAQFQVNGPRKLEWAKELIDLYMKENGGVKLNDYVKKDYKVEPISKNELIKMKLIKVSGLNKEYRDLIFDDNK